MNGCLNFSAWGRKCKTLNSPTDFAHSWREEGLVVGFVATRKKRKKIVLETSSDYVLNKPFLHLLICTVDVAALFVLCRTSRSWSCSLPLTLSSIDNHLQSSCGPLHLNYMKLWGVKRFTPPHNRSKSIWWGTASIPSQSPTRLLLRCYTQEWLEHFPPQSDEDKQSLLKDVAL